MRRLAWIALCLLAVAGCARAQGRSVSYSTWAASGNTVTLRYVLPITEGRRLTGPAVPLLTISRLETYLLDHLSVRSARGDCPAIDQGFDLGRVDPIAAGPDLYGFEILFRCETLQGLRLHDSALFELAPGHIDLARIEMRGQSIEQLFTAQHRELALADEGLLPVAGPGVWLQLGIAHLLDSTDRWCFLLGLLLFVHRPRDAAVLLVALAGGYVMALLLSAAGWIVPRPGPLEVFFGFLVALLGATLVQRETQRAEFGAAGTPELLLAGILLCALLRSPSVIWTVLGGALLAIGSLMLGRRYHDRPVVWPALAVLCSFLDGFVLPGLLLPAQLPRWVELRMSIGFDLGALLCDALIAAIVAGAWIALRRRRYSLPQALVSDVCAAALSGLGAFWLLSRVEWLSI